MTKGRRERVPLGRVWCSVRQYAYHAILNSPNRDGGGPTTSMFCTAELQVWKLVISGTESGTLGKAIVNSVKHITSECRGNATFSLQKASGRSLGSSGGRVLG